MIGFVAVMSSTMAILLLIMSSFMLSMLEGLYYEISDDNIKQDLGFSTSLVSADQSGQSGAGASPLAFNMLSSDQLKVLSSKDFKSISIACSYGNNLSEKISGRYASFNYIFLMKEFGREKVSLAELKFEPSKYNKCELTFDK